MWTDVIFIHIVRSSAVVSLVDTMEISGEVNQLPWQPIQPVFLTKLPPDWQEKLWETHSYSLQIIFALTRHVIPPDLSGLDF